MNTRDLLRMGARNAARSKTRTSLTVLSLFVGALTLTLTTALGAGVNDYVERQVGTLSDGNVLLVSPVAEHSDTEGPTRWDPNGREKTSSAGPLAGGELLNSDDITAMEALDGVTRVTAITQVNVSWVAVSNAENAPRFELSVNPTSSVGRSDLIAGRQLDQSARENQIILPDEYLDALGFDSAEDAVGELVTIGFVDSGGGEQTATGTVVGIARESLFAAGAGANSVLTDVIAKAQAAEREADAWPLAVIELADDDGPDVTDAEIAVVKDELKSLGLNGQTVEDQLGVVQVVINGIIGVLSAFAVIALLAAAFGIVNTLLMSVQERTREIGLMKAMGMSNGRIFGLFSFEAATIGALGGALGALAAVGVGSAISVSAADTLLSGLPGLQILLFDPVNVGAVILVITAVAFLAGVLPARRASAQDPITALRYE